MFDMSFHFYNLDYEPKLHFHQQNKYGSLEPQDYKHLQTFQVSRAEPIQLLQVHHLKVQEHRLHEVNVLKSNQVIDSNYFYNPNYTIKSVKNQ